MFEILIEKLTLYFKSIPSEVKDAEKIAKVVFSPLNVNKSNQLRPNTFRNPDDDLSVNRLDYTTLNACKRLGIRLEKSANMNDKKFYGIALIFAVEIRKIANVFHAPIPNNKAHAVIKIGYNKRKEAGDVNLAEYNFRTEELAKIARLYWDSDVTSKKWIDEGSKEEIFQLTI